MPCFNYDKEKGSFRYWLYRIARNTANTYLRKIYNNNDKLSRYHLDNSCKGVQAFPEVKRLADEEWENHLVNLAIENLRKSVNEKVIQVFLLSIQGKEIREIAEVTGLSPSSIPIYKTRVKLKLMNEISNLRKILE